MNTVDQVPLTMPTSIVNANPRSASPPNRYSARTDSSVVPAVITVRAKRLVDAEVHGARERLAANGAGVLAHPVEDDDGVVHGVADDREQRRRHVQRQVVPGQGQACQRHEQVVQRGGDRADREPKRKRMPM